MLELKNVKKIYQTKAGEIAALNDVSLTFPSTGMIFIIGKSGSGKTTMLNVIGGLDGIDEGSISILGKDFSTFTASEYDSYRNTFIGFIFQEYNLLSEFTVEKNIQIAMELQGRQATDEEIDELLREMEIDGMRTRKPGELSGGQRQRVAIARALVKQPRIIMADEPTGALDSNTGVQMMETLKKLSKDKLVIVVSHDLDLAERYADRMIKLVDGQVHEDVTFTENEIQGNIREREETLIVRDGAELTEEEKNGVARAIKQRKKIEIIERPTYREANATGEVVGEKAENVAFQTSKMKLKSSVTLGLKSLVVKPLRLALTIILSAVAFAVFGLFDAVAAFNRAEVIANYMRNSELTTMIAAGEYAIDKNSGDEYAFKFDADTVARLQTETGLKAKGIYDFKANTDGKTETSYTLGELYASNVTQGTAYYSKAVNGFMEFAYSEIGADGKIGEFDFRVIEGVYPGGNALTTSNANDVAISEYMAESIIHYLDGGTLSKDGEKIVVTEIKDLIGCQFQLPVKLASTASFGSQVFTIVGIVDCGDIPERYDRLKSATTAMLDTKALMNDFTSYINSGAHKYVFTREGQMEHLQNKIGTGRAYYAGSANWKVDDGGTFTKSADQFFYCVDEYTDNNILLFSGNYADGESGQKVTLADDEILIHVDNLQGALFKEAYKDLDQNAKKTVNDIVKNLQSSVEATLTDRRIWLLEMMGVLGLDAGERNIPLVVTKTTSGASKKTEKTLKVVGVYFDVDTALSITSGTFGTNYRFMGTKKMIADFDAYTGQGVYSKILFQLDNNEAAIDTLARYLTNEDGFALYWFGNNILDTIRKNETIIEQAADLFLYAALVLALFSVFMLFNYITTSIVNKRQTIGVLRGLGSGGKDVFLMFMSESLIISLINCVLAAAVAAIACTFVNAYIMQVMNISVTLILFGVRQILMIFLASVLTGVVSSALPIIRIAKEKPVDLIRRE